MQVSSRFASKLLVSSAVAEFFEDKKIEAKEAVEEEYDAAMYDMMDDDGYDPRDYDDAYYCDDYDPRDDYDPYDDYYDPRDDEWSLSDFYSLMEDVKPITREPLLLLPEAGESLGDILSRSLANA